MPAENVVNNTGNTSYNNFSTLAIFHAVQSSQGQLQQQNMTVDVPFIGHNIPAINRDHDFHKKVSVSQLDTEDQFINESQILLQSLQGNSVLSHQDQLSSLIISLQLSSSYLTLADLLIVLLWISQEKMPCLLVLVIYSKVNTCSRNSIILVYMEKAFVRIQVRS